MSKQGNAPRISSARKTNKDNQLGQARMDTNITQWKISTNSKCSITTIDSHLNLNKKRRLPDCNPCQIIWDQTLKLKGIFGGHLNIRSLLSKRDKYIIHWFIQNSLALSEPWLTSNIATELLEIPGCECYCKDRCSGKNGCMILYQFECKMKLDFYLECMAEH